MDAIVLDPEESHVIRTMENVDADQTLKETNATSVFLIGNLYYFLTT